MEKILFGHTIIILKALFKFLSRVSSVLSKSFLQLLFSPSINRDSDKNTCKFVAVMWQHVKLFSGYECFCQSLWSAYPFHAIFFPHTEKWSFGTQIES